MENKEEVLDLLKSLKPEMTARFKVREIALFGSFIRGEQHPGSDIDIVVEFEEEADLFDLVALGDFLEEHLDKKVDLGTMYSLRKEIREQVLMDMATI